MKEIWYVKGAVDRVWECCGRVVWARERGDEVVETCLGCVGFVDGANNEWVEWIRDFWMRWKIMS